MDTDNDGVITIDEFMEACRTVCINIIILIILVIIVATYLCFSAALQVHVDQRNILSIPINHQTSSHSQGLSRHLFQGGV